MLLALVKHPSTEQALVQVEPFPGGLVDPVPDDLNKQLCDAMERLPLPAEHCTGRRNDEETDRPQR